MAADDDETHHLLKLVYITVLIIVAVIGLFLLHVLGSLRRRSSSKTLHIVVITAYTLSYALVSYTLGLMQESKYYFNEFPVWAVCLLMLLGGTDNLMACDLNDVDSWKSFHVKHLLKGALVVYIVAAYTNNTSPYGPDSPIQSMKMASMSNLLAKNVKPIVDYMKGEDKQQLASPATMKGCRYIVAGERRLSKGKLPSMEVPRDKEMDDMKITTVEQIWESNGSLLRSESERGMRLKDVCLSMALSKMLNRRFAGFGIAEAEVANARDFVFNGLLAGDGDKPCERSFRVIEVELGFVYDLYYTRYPYLYHKVRHFALCLPVAMVIFCSWLTYVLFKKRKKVGSGNIPLSTTLFLMAVVTFLEAFQLYLHMASNWFKVALIRSYVTRPALQRSRQYSLLESYNRKCRGRNCWHYVTLWLVDKGRNGCKRGKLVKLSAQVKQAVINSLIRSKDDLKDGVRSPRIHAQLSWACDGTVTHTILVWHIATTICKQDFDAALAKNGKQTAVLSQEEDKGAVHTASTLSQYCAYLIAFSPELLPDHCFDSTSILDQCIEEACKFTHLEGVKKMEDKCQKLLSNSDTDSANDPLIVKGARLARQLMDNQDRWKVLSDFWAEMMLYIAPCDDTQARVHLEALARGGEFITHVWALLTHAGVLKRAPTGPEAV
ncbi:unnamed protein product [Alopecurus aequalis]